MWIRRPELQEQNTKQKNVKQKTQAMVKIGNYDLIESITVIDIDSEPISVNLNGEETGLTFIFRFIKDEKKSDPEINYSIIDNNTAEVKIINADGFLGGGNTNLISLGNLNNRKLYYNFRIFGLHNSGNTIILNFYLGEEVTNG